jgi:hypothetical protein
MEKDDCVPLYVNTDVVRFVTNVVALPITHPTYFDARVNPVRMTLALFGRKGVGKQKLVQHTLDEYGVLNATISVVYGQTTSAMKQILQACATMGAINDEVVPSGVLIIEHADIFCFDPDSTEVMEFALTLKNTAHTSNVILLALFDRLPPTSSTSAHVKPYPGLFFRQFMGGGYMAPPPSAYRVSLFKAYFEAFEAGVGKVANVRLDLSEGDYIELADASTFCTIDTIIEWMQRAFYSYAVPRSSAEEEESKSKLIGIGALVDLMHTAQGFPHICKHDTEALENKWRVACGKGPILTTKPNKDDLLKHNFNNGGNVEMGAEKRKAEELNVTPFTESLVDTEAMQTELKKARK